MILPQKHIKLSESIFAMGGIILSLLDHQKSTSVNDLWEKFKNEEIIDNISFEKFILSLDFLYMIGTVNVNEKGGLAKCI